MDESSQSPIDAMPPSCLYGWTPQGSGVTVPLTHSLINQLCSSSDPLRLASSPFTSTGFASSFDLHLQCPSFLDDLFQPGQSTHTRTTLTPINEFSSTSLTPYTNFINEESIEPISAVLDTICTISLLLLALQLLLNSRQRLLPTTKPFISNRSWQLLCGWLLFHLCLQQGLQLLPSYLVSYTLSMINKFMLCLSTLMAASCDWLMKLWYEQQPHNHTLNHSAPNSTSTTSSTSSSTSPTSTSSLSSSSSSLSTLNPSTVTITPGTTVTAAVESATAAHIVLPEPIDVTILPPDLKPPWSGKGEYPPLNSAPAGLASMEPPLDPSFGFERLTSCDEVDEDQLSSSPLEKEVSSSPTTTGPEVFMLSHSQATQPTSRVTSDETNTDSVSSTASAEAPSSSIPISPTSCNLSHYVSELTGQPPEQNEILTASDGTHIILTKSLRKQITSVFAIPANVPVSMAPAAVKNSRNLLKLTKAKLSKLDADYTASVEKSTQIGAFMAFLCHELRQPLQTIISSTELLVEEENASTTTTSASCSSSSSSERSSSGGSTSSSSGSSEEEESPTGANSHHRRPSQQLQQPPQHHPHKQSHTPIQRELLESIQSSSELMLAIVNDVLDMSRMQSGRMTFERLPIDLYFICHSILNISRTQAATKGLRLELHIEENVPRFVISDPTRLHQLLLNLISNAIKFTSVGGVTLTLKLLQFIDSKEEQDAVIETSRKSHEPVDIPVKAEDEVKPENSEKPSLKASLAELNALPANTIRTPELATVTQPQALIELEVIDTGIGIAEENISKLFQPYAQATRSIQREHGGTGLGLSICTEIVKAMHGKIWVTSEEGHGSVFHTQLLLPVCNDEIIRRGKGLSCAGSYTDSPDTRRLQQSLTPAVTTGESTPVLSSNSSSPILKQPKPKSASDRNSLTLPLQSTPTPASGCGTPSSVIGSNSSSISPPSSMPNSQRLSSRSIRHLSRHISKQSTYKILIVDDHDINCKLLSRMLTSFGHIECHTAYDGVEALERLRQDMEIEREKHHANQMKATPNSSSTTSTDSSSNEVSSPDSSRPTTSLLPSSAPPLTSYLCVFLDIHMPRLDGWGCIQAIRHDLHLSESVLPVIALTAETFEESVLHAAGFTHSIMKPFKKAYLHEMVETILKLQHPGVSRPPKVEGNISPTSSCGESSTYSRHISPIISQSETPESTTASSKSPMNDAVIKRQRSNSFSEASMSPPSQTTLPMQEPRANSLSPSLRSLNPTSASLSKRVRSTNSLKPPRDHHHLTVVHHSQYSPLPQSTSASPRVYLSVHPTSSDGSSLPSSSPPHPPHSPQIESTLNRLHQITTPDAVNTLNAVSAATEANSTDSNSLAHDEHNIVITRPNSLTNSSNGLPEPPPLSDESSHHLRQTSSDSNKRMSRSMELQPITTTSSHHFPRHLLGDANTNPNETNSAGPPPVHRRHTHTHHASTDFTNSPPLRPSSRQLVSSHVTTTQVNGRALPPPHSPTKRGSTNTTSFSQPVSQSSSPALGPQGSHTNGGINGHHSHHNYHNGMNIPPIPVRPSSSRSAVLSTTNSPRSVSRHLIIEPDSYPGFVRRSTASPSTTIPISVNQSTINESIVGLGNSNNHPDATSTHL